MNHYDAVVVGGGVIGCSIARSLATGNWKVAVVERAQPGGEASWAAAGMLSPSSEAEEGSPLFPLCRASLKLYAALAAELEAETGIDPQYRTEGTLLVYRDEGERAAMLRSIEWQRRMDVTIGELSLSELHRVEPRIANCQGAFFLNEDHQIDNRLLMKALVESCIRRGVAFATGRGAQEVCCDRGRVTGVATGGETIGARHVVNATGAWAAELRVAGLAPAAIRPVKGHMVSLKSAAAPIAYVVRSHGTYLVPRSDGRVIVGSTMEEAGFDKTVQPDSIETLVRSARRICPTLDSSVIAETWTGLRPASPDGLPILGPTPIEGYWTALGHLRNGILLAPITALIMSAWIADGTPPAEFETLDLSRFSN